MARVKQYASERKNKLLKIAFIHIFNAILKSYFQYLSLRLIIRRKESKNIQCNIDYFNILI